MGSMTRSELITEGLLQAGISPATYATRAATWLKLWLKSQYRAWPWPFLLQSREALALPAGTTSLAVGNGSGGITEEIARILSPIWVYDSSYGTRMKAPIIEVVSFDPADNETINNPTTNRGLPTRFKVRTNRTGGLVNSKLIPLPVPNRDFLLQFNYIEIPIDPASSGTTVPLYKNDQTMIAAIKTAALREHLGSDDPQYQVANNELLQMAVADRVKDGLEPGFNDMVGLDNSVFR
jgi:hypothetical protein